MLVSRPKAGTSADDHLYHKFRAIDSVGMSGPILISSCAGRKLERENIVRPDSLQPNYLCTRCFSPEEIRDIANDHTLFDERPRTQPQPKMTIVWMDGKHYMYDLTTAGGWDINLERNVLILGHGTPRMEFPLCNIRYYLIEPAE